MLKIIVKDKEKELQVIINKTHTITIKYYTIYIYTIYKLMDKTKTMTNKKCYIK